MQPLVCQLVAVLLLLLHRYHLRLATLPQPLVCQLIVALLLLSCRRHLLSSPCAATPCDAPPPPCNMLPPLVRWRLSSCFPLICRLVVTSHLVTPPPHVSTLNPYLHWHRLVIVLHLLALPPPPALLSTLPSLDAPPPHIALATHLQFASNLPQMIACVFDLACLISWFLAVISKNNPYCTTV